MTTYKEQIQRKKHYVINKNNITIGLYTSLKKLCSDMKEIDEKFPSYWTIIKIDKSKPIIIKDYIIQELKAIPSDKKTNY